MSGDSNKVTLNESLRSWGSQAFKDIFSAEVARLDVAQLPLQQALSHGNYTSGEKLGVMVLNVTDDAEYIHVKSGVFYTGMITGCSCADDPTPIDEHTEYCEIRFDINKATAETLVTLLLE